MLFFTPACPNCAKIKTFMEDKDLENEWIDATTAEGLMKAKEFKVMGVPVVIFLDENGKEVTRATDIEEIKRVIENKQLA